MTTPPTILSYIVQHFFPVVKRKNEIICQRPEEENDNRRKRPAVVAIVYITPVYKRNPQKDK
jgi:hypothetical protein